MQCWYLGAKIASTSSRTQYFGVTPNVELMKSSTEEIVAKWINTINHRSSGCICSATLFKCYLPTTRFILHIPDISSYLRSIALSLVSYPSSSYNKISHRTYLYIYLGYWILLCYAGYNIWITNTIYLSSFWSKIIFIMLHHNLVEYSRFVCVLVASIHLVWKEEVKRWDQLVPGLLIELFA